MEFPVLKIFKEGGDCLISYESGKLYSCVKLAPKNLAGSDPVIIPYMVVNRIFITLGIITGLMSARILRARYTLAD